MISPKCLRTVARDAKFANDTGKGKTRANAQPRRNSFRFNELGSGREIRERYEISPERFFVAIASGEHIGPIGMGPIRNL